MQPGGDPLVLCFVDFVSPAHAATAMDALQGEITFSHSYVEILEYWIYTLDFLLNLIPSTAVISVMPYVELSICLEIFTLLLLLQNLSWSFRYVVKIQLLLDLLIYLKIDLLKPVPDFW